MKLKNFNLLRIINYKSIMYNKYMYDKVSWFGYWSKILE